MKPINLKIGKSLNLLKEDANETKYHKEIRVLLGKIWHGNADQKKYARKKLKEKYGITVYNQHQKARYEDQNRKKTVQGNLV